MAQATKVVFASSALDDGYFYRLRDAIGPDTVLVAFCWRPISEERAAALSRYVDEIIVHNEPMQM